MSETRATYNLVDGNGRVVDDLATFAPDLQAIPVYARLTDQEKAAIRAMIREELRAVLCGVTCAVDGCSEQAGVFVVLRRVNVGLVRVPLCEQHYARDQGKG